MGIDPESPNYPSDTVCSVCESVIFGGSTPIYVEAHIDGVVKCPGAIIEFRNGVFLLSNVLSPCRWSFVEGMWSVEWILTPTTSTLVVASTSIPWFKQTIVAACQTQFVNANVCGFGFAVGSGGTGEVFWGPTIDP